MAEKQPKKTTNTGFQGKNAAPRSRGRLIPVLTVVLLLVAAGAGLWLYMQLNAPVADVPAQNAPKASDPDYVTDLPPLPVDAAPQAGDVRSQPEAEAGSGTVRRPVSRPTVMTPDFITDLAAFVAANYHPAGTVDNEAGQGMSTLSFKRLNMRYGLKFTGLAHTESEPIEIRRQILASLLNPIVMRLFYDHYRDGFLAALVQAGRNQTRDFKTAAGIEPRPLGDGHIREMLRLTAMSVHGLGQCFAAFARRQDLCTSGTRYFQAAAAVNEAYGRYADLEAEGAGGQSLDAASDRIKDAITTRETLKTSIISGIRPKGSKLDMSDGEIMDVAAWIHRRLSFDPEAINAVGAVASLAGELSQDLLIASRGDLAPPNTTQDDTARDDNQPPLPRDADQNQAG